MFPKLSSSSGMDGDGFPMEEAEGMEEEINGNVKTRKWEARILGGPPHEY